MVRGNKGWGEAGIDVEWVDSALGASDMAVVVVGIFSGAMTTMLGYWFSERKAKK